MNTCIYTKKTEPDVSFKNQEHIFPAALGGIKKLPKGYVCDEINGEFSNKLEVKFLRTGFISIIREFSGPGSRGNISNPKKAYQSSVTLVKNNNEEYSLGYISLGKPYIISQIELEIQNDMDIKVNSELKLKLKPEISDINIELKKFSELEEDSIIEIYDSNIPENKVLIGFHEFYEKGKGKSKIKWYFASNEIKGKKIIIDNVKKRLPDICNIIKRQNINARRDKEQVSLNNRTEIDFNILYRSCAKIAFNYIASILGVDIILNKAFDEIRGYIINGGDYNNITLMDDSQKEFMSKNCLNIKDKHLILADINYNVINIIVNLYGYLAIGLKIEIGSNLIKKETLGIHATIIDYNKRKEIDLMDYIVGIGLLT